ncbi:ScyD/ScyE family protein [Microbacterium sp. SS28]|uniref:ScyD/ScyE family protein n=1 Tax=Microbacterium sp. SS28 TaxID=2919948 RepID=UPI001FA9C869|nr:ScyD/ScyE family protein [Microbacterium sp. SS28]
MRTSRALAAGVAVAALVLATPVMASAAGKGNHPDPEVRSDQVVAPFNLALPGSDVYVADGFTGLVGTLQGDGSLAPVAMDQPGTSGVDLSADGSVLAFTTTVSDFETGENLESGLNLWGPGDQKVYADTHAYEAANNPDSVNHYGIDNPSDCVADAFASMGFPYDYMGQIDSHAYSVAAYGDGWVVADAGANALWSIDAEGDVSTLAVLPPQPVVITADMAAALELPECVAGVTYAFEPVPTDVEVAADGSLYVTTLPGGPESPVLGARGSLWKFTPSTGALQKIAGGFLGATNLAIGWKGEIYVAEYFAGKISVVKKNGKKSDYTPLQNVIAVETAADGTLWAGTTINLDPTLPPVPGTIVQVNNGHPGKHIGLN